MLKSVRWAVPLLAAVILLGFNSQAAPPGAIATGHCDGTIIGLAFKEQPKDGCYCLCIENGTVTVTSMTCINVDGPNPPPPPPQPDILAKAIIAEINKVPANNKRHEVALKLSKTYEMLAGTPIPPAKAVEAVTQIVSLALQSDVQVLAGVYPIVNAALGKCTTEAGVSVILKEAATAVASTVPAAVEGETEAEMAKRFGFDWDKFLAFLMELIKILLPLIIKI